MGIVIKVIEAITLLLMLIIALAVPLFDAQLILSLHLFPDFLINFMDWFILQFDHYLLVEKPNFYVGLAWLQLLFNWPLSVAGLYAYAAGNPWFTTTSLVLGSSFFTCLVAILGELLGSGRASYKLLLFYNFFLCLAVLTIVRGLLPTTSIGKRLGWNEKKKMLKLSELWN